MVWAQSVLSWNVDKLATLKDVSSLVHYFSCKQFLQQLRCYEAYVCVHSMMLCVYGKAWVDKVFITWR